MIREPSVSTALERTYEAGQSLIVRGVDLLMAETKLLLRDGRTFGIGVLAALAGWLFLMHGLVDGLAERYPRFAVELAVGLAHVGAAALFALRARSAPPRRERER
jgi:hypothetical protein